MDSLPVVLVTGGAAGIGRAIADRFIAAGYAAHVCDNDREAVDEFLARSPGASATVADISSVADVDAIFADMGARYSRLDVLINNAGIAGPTALAEDIEPVEWDRTIAVSLSGQFYVTRKAIPLLRRSNRASIINISSNAAFFGFPMRLPYTASKWALIGMTKTLAMELGPHGIRVNAICPGSVSGPRIDRVIRKDAEERGMKEDEIRHIYTRQSSMRRFVEANDVADLAYFLASDAGAMISGQAIGVDGHTESLSNWLD